MFERHLVEKDARALGVGDGQLVVLGELLHDVGRPLNSPEEGFTVSIEREPHPSSAGVACVAVSIEIHLLRHDFVDMRRSLSEVLDELEPIAEGFPDLLLLTETNVGW